MTHHISMQQLENTDNRYGTWNILANMGSKSYTTLEYLMNIPTAKQLYAMRHLAEYCIDAVRELA